MPIFSSQQNDAANDTPPPAPSVAPPQADTGTAPPPTTPQPSLDDLVAQDKLPNIPKVLDAIRAGKVSVEDVMARHVDIKKQIADGKIDTNGNPIPQGEASTQNTTPSPFQKEIAGSNPEQDKVLQELVHQDLLPAIPRVLDAIKNGEVDLNTVMERHKQIKAQMPNMTGDKAGNITVNPAGEQGQNSDQSAAPKTTGNEAGFLLGPAQDAAEVVKGIGAWAGKTVDSAKEGMKKDWDFYQQNSSMPFNEAIQASLKREEAGMTYVAKKYASGLSFDIYDPDMEAPGFKHAAMGAMASLAGNIGSGLLGGAALKALPIVGPALSALEESAGKSVGLAKHAKNIAGIVAEAGPLGFASGAAKSAIHGNRFSDVMADGLIDGGMFAGAGALLYPVAEVGGKIFARAKVGRAAGAAKAAIKEGLPIAEAGASPVEGVVSAEGKTVSRAEIAMDNIKNIPEESRTPDQKSLLSGLERIRATQPIAGPFQVAELVRDPEVLKGLLGEDAKRTAQGLFSDPEAPLRGVYDTNPSIRSMVDSGNYIDALQSAQGAFREQVKDFKNVGEMISAPFINDANSVYNVVADRVLGRADPIKYPRLNRNLIINYFNEGTDAAKQALMEAVPKGQKRILGREVFGNLQDVRFTPSEADKLVGDVLKSHFETINNGGAIGFENLGKLRDTDSIIKAAITFNKNISQTMIQSYREGYGSLQDSFIRAPEDLQGGIRDEINIRRILKEKSDAVSRVRESKGHMQDLNVEMKSTTDPVKQEALKKQLDTLRIDLKDSSTNLFNMRKAMNEASTAIESLPPEKQAQIRGFVDKVYLPDKTQLNVKSTADYLNRFDYKDNPVYLKNGSALSDHMNAMLVAGRDTDIAKFSSFQLPFGLNIENLTQKMNKEFGPNNPIEQFFRQIKERDAAIHVTKETYYDKIRSIGMKEGTEESALLHRFAEKRLLTTDTEFLALPQKVQNKLIEGDQTLRSVYDELVDAHNDMARSNNIPEITKRADYVTHYKEAQTFLPSLLESWSAGSKEMINPFDNKPFNISMASRGGDPSKPFFRWELKRSGGEFTEDAIGSMKRYVGPALERIFYTDLVREADAARAFAPNNMGVLFDRVKKNYLLKAPPDMEGETSKAFKSVLKGFTKKMAEGELLFKVNTAVQQITSMALNFSGGGREAIAAATKLFSKEADRRWGMSLNGALRDAVEGTDLDAKLFSGLLKDWNGSKVAQTAKTGFDYYKKFGRSALEIFDKVAAKHAYLTGFEKAVKGGLPEQQAAVYADKWVDAIHNSLATIDKPDSAIFRTTIGKALFQFQSYSINLAATLMNDLPNMAFHDGAASAVTSVLRAGAAISLVNEGFRDIGLPAPFAMKEFVPLMGTYRFGAPGYFAAVKTGVKALSGNDTDVRQAKKEGVRLAASLAFPGGGQAYNVANAFSEKAKGNIMKKDMPKAIAFGASAVKQGSKQKEEAKQAEGQRSVFGLLPSRKKARQFIKSHLF